MRKEVEAAVENVKHVSNLLNEAGLANADYYKNVKIIIGIAELWIAGKIIESHNAQYRRVELQQERIKELEEQISKEEVKND